MTWRRESPPKRAEGTRPIPSYDEIIQGIVPSQNGEAWCWSRGMTSPERTLIRLLQSLVRRLAGLKERRYRMITAIVLYDLPPSVGLEECRAHFTKIAPDFLKIPGFLRKQFICARGGKVAGGVYMWESQEAAERFYSGEWLAGIRDRYGTEPKISYFETVALTDKLTGQAGGLD
jgi:hypothetical protein